MRPRQLNDIDNPLERAVFRARYDGAGQRALRVAAVLLLALKHGMRGLLYVWPLAILMLVDLPGAWDGIRLALILLAAAAWFQFVYQSILEDYRRLVRRALLSAQILRRVLR